MEAALAAERGASDEVEFVDGGTQGLALLHYFADRRAVLLLDAVGLGAEPQGSVHALRGRGERRSASAARHHGARRQRAGTAGHGAAAGRCCRRDGSGGSGTSRRSSLRESALSPQVAAGLPAAIERDRCWTRCCGGRRGPADGPAGR